ncbi:response regulator [Alteromonadaceae bacterium M269]|nr:response regulator [Alteromonadaceae bacterium M269]
MATPKPAERKNVTIAIVEDNGAARLNLRNHLLEIGFVNIGCYSQGRELKSALRKKTFDLLLMDFHLGINKNGVEVIQDLTKEKLIKHSTSIIFVTSDRMPLIIGQIVDVHPEALVLKPYTIRNLERTVSTVLKLHRYLRPVYKAMDDDRYDDALNQLEEMLTMNALPRQRMSLIKLKARLLTRTKQFDEAISIYEEILKKSHNIIWARWGLIQNTFLSGDITKSEKMLEDMLGTHLTNDKACEWLARININNEQYQKAEEYVSRIKEGEMSMTAARLKAYLYQIQENIEDAIKVIERKRESNRSIRERYSELSFDLARMHISLAEQKTPNQRKSSLQVAKQLIGNAGRKNTDEDMSLRRNYLHALVAVLEENTGRAKEILDQEGMKNFERADISTLSDASSAWFGVGDKEMASELLAKMGERIESLPDENEKTISNLMVTKNEQSQGSRRSRALEFNRIGMDFYVNKDYDEALKLFYQAYILFPDEHAFGLNLLQSMVEAYCKEHRTVRVLRLYSDLNKCKLSEGNLKRLADINEKIEANRNQFVVIDKPAPTGDLSQS